MFLLFKLLQDSAHKLSDLTNYDVRQRGHAHSYLTDMAACADVMVASQSSDHTIVGYVVAFTKGQEVIIDGLYAESDVIAAKLLR